MLGLFRKCGEGVYEVAPGMSETVCKNGFEGAGQVSARSIAHLDRGRQLGNPLREEILKVFAGVVGAGEKAHYGSILRSSYDSGGKHPLSLRILELLLLHEGQDFDGSVVVVQDLSLCGRSEQFFINGGDLGGG